MPYVSYAIWDHISIHITSASDNQEDTLHYTRKISKKGVKKFFLRLFIFNKIQSIYCTQAPLSSTLNPSGVVVFVSMAPSAPR